MALEGDHDDLCKWCGGLKSQRQPMGEHCDHLYWPDNLTDAAKRANGYVQRPTLIWITDPADGVLRQAKYDPQT